VQATETGVVVPGCQPAPISAHGPQSARASPINSRTSEASAPEPAALPEMTPGAQGRADRIERQNDGRSAAPGKRQAIPTMAAGGSFTN